MKEQRLEYKTIRGEFPTTIPDTHILVRDVSVGEAICDSFFLVPRTLWEEFETIRTKVEEQAQLVYEEDHDYSPVTSIFTAYPYKEDN